MRASADVVIVGGGVMGCSILYNLAVRGITDTVLLEKTTLASGSTGRTQAILRTHYSNEVTSRMAWESLKVFRDFEEIIGAPSGYIRCGYLLIVGNKDRRALEENVAMQKKVGIDTDVVSATDVKEIAPAMIVGEDEAVAYEAESGYVDAYSVTNAYARRARDMGAQVWTNALATGIEVTAGRVTGVLTSEARVATPVAIVAAGPWSKSFLGNLGIDLPLYTVRHQMIMLRRQGDQIPDHPMVADVVNSFSSRPDAGSVTLIGVGESDPAEPETFNQGVDMDVVVVLLTQYTN